MEVDVPDEPQSKKIFRARKTVKTSDRQQLESIHNSSSVLPSSSSALSSSSPPLPAAVNGKSPEGEQTETEKTPELMSRSNASSSPAHSPNSAGKQSEGDNGEEDQGSSLTEGGETMDNKKTEGGEAKVEEDCSDLQVKDKEAEDPKSDGDVSSPLDSPQDPIVTSVSPLPSETTEEESKTETDKRTEPEEEAVATDTDPAPMETKVLEVSKSVRAADPTSSSSPSPSPSHAPESDQEVKEGFLVLSEEDETQGERGEGEKEKESVTENQDGEQTEMEVHTEEKEAREDVGVAAPSVSPPSPSSSPPPPPSGDTGVQECSSVPSAKKRALCEDTDMETDGRRERGEEGGAVREGKRRKVEGEELEAQLEFKIRADGGTRLKLEKVVQQLVEERLQVLQLSVFDRNLQELRERVDKMDCATKHQQTLNTLQAKVARLAKKCGAANQAKENIRNPQEVCPLKSPANATPTPTASATSTFRPVRTMVAHQSNQSPPPRSLSATAQPKPLFTATPPPASPTVSAPILSLIPASSTSDTASSSRAPGASQNQSATLPLKTIPADTAVSLSTPSPHPVPLQPLLIQLPLTVANAQGGSIVTNHSARVELIPVSSLGTVATLNRAKTTTAGTAFVLQKSGPSSSSSVASLPPSPSLPQMAFARAACPGGGSSALGVPSSGVSVSVARAPTHCVSVVGVASSSSMPVSSAPAATGAQSAVPGPPSVTAMASKTDNQATSSAASKPPAQVPRTSKSGAVIDLTEDDDDVQVTGFNHPARPSNGFHTEVVSPHWPASGEWTLSAPSPPTDLPVQDPPGQRRPGTPVRPRVRPAAPLPSPPPPPARLPPQATRSSPPQRPQLKLARVQSQSGIVLSWCTEGAELTCAPVDSYHLYAYHQEHAGQPSSQWKKIGEVKALPLPMACTLTQFVSGSTYYFAVCARDIYGRFGPFCEPQCTDVTRPSSCS
ncbi:hypothetical protein AAFF_G00260890 [Aldrovandia affinis]|uniref:Fibronectin type-III domain-containing protein n=1 Tax=Aldrovandia affinis TaxID=143900 RepID=A0AAD7W2L2_9TELE|nr:hypothetical protein AAFF_G00260890 [Aldrovandia affinis]